MATPLTFQIELAKQIEEGQMLQHVPNCMPPNGWSDNANPPKDWAVNRWEGAAKYGFGWFAMDWHRDNPWQNEPRWWVDENGNYTFVPLPQIKQSIDYCLNSGLLPYVVMGTPNIPEPLIEGGFTTGQYGYNIHQPTDYKKWHYYLVTLFQWLADTYGRDAVREWVFMFGIEMDWQIKCVYPGTNNEMSTGDNAVECLKMLDWYIDAAEEILGKNLNIGCYFAFPGQGDTAIKHWGEEKNFANGETGTRVGWVGFSDWAVRDLDDFNPFADPKRVQDQQWVGWTYTAGTKWKYDYLARLLDQYPSLKDVQIHLPEQGYFDTKGGFDVAGNPVPADVIYADYRGASLYTMRTICYAECPRITTSWTRYGLSTNDLGDHYFHEVLPPLYNAIRISQRMAGCRKLPVKREGELADTSNDVRLLAGTANEERKNLRLVMTNFNEDFNADKPETIQIKLVGFSADVEKLSVRIYRIDAQHNNWWQDWINYREANDIAYVASNNYGHLGRGIRYRDDYAPYISDIWGTMAPEDWQKWVAQAPSYKAASTLEPTEPDFNIAVKNGLAELSLTLPSLGTVFIEIAQ